MQHMLLASTTISQLVAQHHADIAKGAAILAGVVAHYLTAFLTHKDASPRLKAAVAIFFSALGAVIVTTVWATSEPWYLWVEDIGRALFASQGLYLLRSITGATWLQNIGPSFGDPEKVNPTDASDFPGADGSYGDYANGPTESITPATADPVTIVNNSTTTSNTGTLPSA